MDNRIKTLQKELEGTPPHIISQTLEYLRFLKQKNKEDIIGYSVGGKALTPENYKTHIDSSRDEYEKGKFTNVDDL